MSADVKITKQLDNNHVQIDITGKNVQPRYYKVPNNKADYFVKTYEKQSKNISTLSFIALITASLAGVLAVRPFTKKLDSLPKFLLNTTGGIAGAVLGSLGVAQYMENSQDKLMETSNAQEIYYFG